MKDIQNKWQDVCARRAVLRGAALAIGAAAATSLGSNSATAQAKIAKTVVAYQDTPKGEQRCDGCALFEAPNACKTVAGDVAPEGWCRIWQRKGS
jgi:hypothetical protein